MTSVNRSEFATIPLSTSSRARSRVRHVSHLRQEKLCLMPTCFPPSVGEQPASLGWGAASPRVSPPSRRGCTSASPALPPRANANAPSAVARVTCGTGPESVEPHRPLQSGAMQSVAVFAPLTGFAPPAVSRTRENADVRNFSTPRPIHFDPLQSKSLPVRTERSLRVPGSRRTSSFPNLTATPSKSTMVRC